MTRVHELIGVCNMTSKLEVFLINEHKFIMIIF